MIGYLSNAVRISNRGATKLLNNKSHGRTR